MKLSVTKRFEFSAAHQLIHHDGKCRNMHGHNFVLEVTYGGVEPSDINFERSMVHPETNMVVDFSRIKDLWKPFVDQLDHQILNSIVDKDSPTAERVIEWFVDNVPHSNISVGLVRVRLYETPDSYAELEFD